MYQLILQSGRIRIEQALWSPPLRGHLGRPSHSQTWVQIAEEAHLIGKGGSLDVRKSAGVTVNFEDSNTKHKEPGNLEERRIEAEGPVETGEAAAQDGYDDEVEY